jgi:hypothetical protein
VIREISVKMKMTAGMQPSRCLHLDTDAAIMIYENRPFIRDFFS